MEAGSETGMVCMVTTVPKIRDASQADLKTSTTLWKLIGRKELMRKKTSGEATLRKETATVGLNPQSVYKKR